MSTVVTGSTVFDADQRALNPASAVQRLLERDADAGRWVAPRTSRAVAEMVGEAPDAWTRYRSGAKSPGAAKFLGWCEAAEITITAHADGTWSAERANPGASMTIFNPEPGYGATPHEDVDIYNEGHDIGYAAREAGGPRVVPAEFHGDRAAGWGDGWDQHDMDERYP